MEINFGSRTHLTREELVFLVNGVRVVIEADRYADIVLVGTSRCLSQVRLFTRWTRRADPRHDVVSERVIAEVAVNCGPNPW